MTELERFKSHVGYVPQYVDGAGGYRQLVKALAELETRIEALEKAAKND